MLELARNLPNSGEISKDEIYSILELESSGRVFIALNQTLELLEILYEKDKTIFDTRKTKTKISKSLINRLLFLNSLDTQNAFDTLFNSENFSKQIARLIYEEIPNYNALQLADAVVVKFQDESLADEILSKVKRNKITKDCRDKILGHSFSSQKVLFFICDEVFDTFPLEFALKSKFGREVFLIKESPYPKEIRDISLLNFCEIAG
ncbi:MAG: hypothetical protein MR902_07400 [Campylobacter sp.]|nr:hypothetical protein [Campylobacter sp.]